MKLRKTMSVKYQVTGVNPSDLLPFSVDTITHGVQDQVFRDIQRGNKKGEFTFGKDNEMTCTWSYDDIMTLGKR